MSKRFHVSAASLLQLIAGIWLAWASGVPGIASAEPNATSRLGFLGSIEELEASLATEGAAHSAPVRVDLDWQVVERTPGLYDWTPYDGWVERLAEAGRTIVLVIGGTNSSYLPDGGLPSSNDGESLAAWVAYVRAAVQHFGDQAQIFQVGDRVGQDPELEARLEALVIKQASLAVRAEGRARGRVYRVVQPAVEADDLDYQRALWSQDVAAYVDVVPVLLQSDEPLAIRGFSRESVKYPPAVEVWAYAEAGRVPRPAEAAARSLAQGASTALFRLPRDSRKAGALASWGLTLDKMLRDGFAPAPRTGLRFEGEDREILGRFFNESGFESLVVYTAAREGQESLVRLFVDAAVVREARVVDPESGDVRRLPAIRQRSGEQLLELPPSALPGIVLFRQAAVGGAPSLPPEEIAIASTRGLTAEEIIARHQEVQRNQQNRLERFTAKGRVNYNFRLTEGGSTIDVSIDSQYFWERGGELEWEQLEYYFNGNKVNWKKFPRIPLIQPEKVITLPLDLTLNKTYAYRLLREEKVDGRSAYVLDFKPASSDTSLNLYRGRIWIDTEQFYRLKLRLIQSGLDPPVISNEELDLFAETIGPDGGSYVLFSKIDGQQVWNVAGRTFVVRRELTFRDIRINPPAEEFGSRQRQAYESPNTMMRDTEKGFRYLDRTAEGDRVVKEKVASSTLFIGAGAFKDASQENVVPLAAVNYFDYDVADKNLQLNVFFAGAFAFASLSKPDLFGGRMDLTLDLGLAAIRFNDKLFLGDDELEYERLDRRPQRLSLRMGFPLGDFFKVNFIGGLTYWEYGLAELAEESIALFNAQPGNPTIGYELPQDHFDLSGGVEGRFNRRGYSVVARVRQSRRSDWAAWGLQDTNSGEYGSVDPLTGTFVPAEPEPVYDSYTRWGVTAFKEWFLPHFQRLRVEGNYLDGVDLDRFSRYQFSYFGADRLNGFSGSGVRFDQGVLGRLGYTFNLAEVIRFDLGLDTARVEDQRGGAGAQNFTGIGINAEFPAPWRTVVTLGYGRALASDVPEFKGEQEFLLLILKLF